jgi:hypothetical protein
MIKPTEMGTIVKLDEQNLRKIIMSEIKNKLNEVHVKSTDELADGDYGKMCGILKGKIESLYMWKDYCETLEDLQELIGRTFDSLMA